MLVEKLSTPLDLIIVFGSKNLKTSRSSTCGLVLVLSDCNLQHAQDFFAAKCEAGGTRISTSMSEAMVDCFLYAGEIIIIFNLACKLLWILQEDLENGVVERDTWTNFSSRKVDRYI